MEQTEVGPYVYSMCILEELAGIGQNHPPDVAKTDMG